MYSKILNYYIHCKHYSLQFKYSSLVKICNGNKKKARLVLDYFNNSYIDFYSLLNYSDNKLKKILSY